jgi:hypothetical protein
MFRFGYGLDDCWFNGLGVMFGLDILLLGWLTVLEMLWFELIFGA